MDKSDEKSRRVYYQDIVYSVCGKLDKIFGLRTVCGNAIEPNDQVQKRMAIVCEVIEESKNVVTQFRHHGGPFPQYPELHEAIEKLQKALSR